MILDAFETMLDHEPPAWVRKREAVALMGVFAQAFEVDAPSLEAASADEALRAFREFTAACMQAALVDAASAETYRVRLGDQARSFGAKVRRTLPVRSSSAFRFVRFFYRGIGINLTGDVPGELRFGPCSFAQRYLPGECWLMSAFDEGFISGFLGKHGALEFSCRLTEGASCCRATFVQLGGSRG